MHTSVVFPLDIDKHFSNRFLNIKLIVENKLKESPCSGVFFHLDVESDTSRIKSTRFDRHFFFFFKYRDTEIRHSMIFEYEGDTHFTCTVPAVLGLHPQLLIPVDQTVGAAGPLAVTALQLGQPGLCIVQLHEHRNTGVKKKKKN